MAVKFTKVCGSNRPRTKLDFGRIAKKVTKIHHPGCCDSAIYYMDSLSGAFVGSGSLFPLLSDYSEAGCLVKLIS